MGAEYFEELYRADQDPWDLATSDYERGKYDLTIAALGERPFAPRAGGRLLHRRARRAPGGALRRGCWRVDVRADRR